jgi:hypothetical protein
MSAPIQALERRDGIGVRLVNIFETLARQQSAESG